MNRQQRRERNRKIIKTISKIQVAQRELSEGVSRAKVRSNLRALAGYHAALEQLGIVRKQSLFQKLKSIIRGFKAWR